MRNGLSWLLKALAVAGVMLCGIDARPVPAKDNAFVDRVTLRLCETLEGFGERYCRRGGARAFLSTLHLHNVVASAYEAAAINPSFGSAEEVTVKLVAAAYGESRFDNYAQNLHLNKNCTVDVGILQVNSVHLGKTWTAFCGLYGFPAELTRLYDTRQNILFAAYVNEMMMRQSRGRTAYRFDRKGRQRTLYQALRAEIHA